MEAQFDEELPSPPVLQETKPSALLPAKKRIEKHIHKVNDDTSTTEAVRNLREAENGSHEVAVVYLRNKQAFDKHLMISKGLSWPHVIEIADGIQADMLAHRVRMSGLPNVALSYSMA